MIGTAIAAALLLLSQATLAERAVPFEGDWRIAAAGSHFDITFRTAGPGDLERIAGTAERAYGQISSRFKHELPFRPLIVVYRTGAELAHARATRTFPGNREHMLWALDMPVPQADGQFLHELTHVFVFDIVPPGVRAIPAWLHEGLAERQRGEWAETDREVVRARLRQGTLPSPVGLPPNAADDGRLETIVGHLAVDLLAARAGEDAPLRLLARLRTGAVDPFDAYLDLAGLARADFERAFADYAERQFPRAALAMRETNPAQ